MPTQCSFAFVGTSDWTSGCVTSAGKPFGVIEGTGKWSEEKMAVVVEVCRRGKW
jgi:hypothetical protein